MYCEMVQLRFTRLNWQSQIQHLRVLRLFALLFCLNLSQAFAQDGGVISEPRSVDVRAEPRVVLLGQPFVLHVVVTHDSTQRYELKLPGDLGDFEFLKHTRQRASDTQTNFDIELSAFELGKKQTPEMKLEVFEPTATGATDIPTTEIEVVSALPKTAETDGENLFDVKKPEEVLVRTWRVLWAMLIALTIGVLAYYIYKYVNRPKPVAPIALIPVEPLHVRTRNSLDALRNQNLPQSGKYKEYYFRLSEIIRGYLGERFDFEALECTTPELIDALKKRTTPGLNIQELSQFANESDFARYAKAEPSVEQCETHLQVAYRIVHNTTASVPKSAASAVTILEKKS
jgi:hypothetical protein